MTTNLPSEDVGALVVDVGSHETRAGFAGEDTPKSVYPSVVGVTLHWGDASQVGNYAEAMGEEDRKRWKTGSADIAYRRDDMELRSPFDEEGLPSNTPVLQALLDHAFESRLRCNVREHPVLLVEPSWNSSQVREKMTQLMFESYITPGLFISKSAVLATFMNAKATALVLDVGHGWSSAVAVHEGYVLHKCVQRSVVAGHRLNQDLLRVLTASDGSGEAPVVHPRYACERTVDKDTGALRVAIHDYPRTHPSYRSYMIHEVVRDLKETVCSVSDVDFSESVYEKVPSVPYQLPDGRTLQLGSQRFKTPELLFKPDLYSAGTAAAGAPEEKVRGVHELVYSAVQMADTELRRDLWGSVCLAGGTTLMTGFRERLERDLSNMSPSKVRVTASSFPVERKYSSWIGGSILASLGTFQQMWISKAEYDENGASICTRKCP